MRSSAWASAPPTPDALLQAGAWGEAARRFAEAEAMQRESQPDLPLLYSLQGYQWCADLKLAQARFRRGHCAIASISLRGASREIRCSTTLSKNLRLAAPRIWAAIAERGADITSGAPQLDAAVDGLRAAGNIPTNSRTACSRALPITATRATASSPPLTSPKPSRSPSGAALRLFLADCWLESARQRLAIPNASRGTAETRAAEAVVRAEKIVEETGYHRRDPDLAMVRAELALLLGDAAAARSNLDAVIAAMRAHDLRSFLPEVVRLAERYGLGDIALTIADLRVQRARFDAEADAAFEEARKVRRADGLDDDVIDARLADPAFRAGLSMLLVANGYKPLDETPIDEQRKDARQYIPANQAQAGRRRGARGHPAEGGTDPPQSPTRLSRRRLATPTSAGCWTRCLSNPARPSSPTSTPPISARPRAR